MSISADHQHAIHAPARDPVCGMGVDPATSRYRELHDGTICGFCSERCRAKFAADPLTYVEPQPAAAPDQAVPGVIYTCPMHPEIRKPIPGHCPICGMALEPEGVVEEVSVSPELALMQHRVWVGAAFAVPLVLLDMGAHFAGFDLHRYVPPNMSVWLEFVLATPVVLWCAWPFFEGGWASLKSRHLNMFTLIALGVGVGYAYSVIATVAPGLFPPAVRGGPDRWHRARRPQRRR
jgi:Cu+-exporting ATPase